jgi:phosphoserine aminotransferase
MHDWHGTGLSVLEMSHRSPEFTGISNKAKADLRKFLSIPDNFKIFFFQGGATMQYAAVIKNLLKHDKNGKSMGASYVTTGLWSEQTIREAMKMLGDADPPLEIVNTKGTKYT